MRVEGHRAECDDRERALQIGSRCSEREQFCNPAGPQFRTFDFGEHLLRRGRAFEADECGVYFSLAASLDREQRFCQERVNVVVVAVVDVLGERPVVVDAQRVGVRLRHLHDE